MENEDAPVKTPLSKVEIPNYYTTESHVLTKREQFALHAPPIPDWFIVDTSSLDSIKPTDIENGMISYYLCHNSKTDPIKVFPIRSCKNAVDKRNTYEQKVEMLAIKQWRYAFADMMLEDK